MSATLLVMRFLQSIEESKERICIALRLLLRCNRCDRIDVSPQLPTGP